MTTRNIIALSMVKGIGPAYIKKIANRLSTSNGIEDFIKEKNPSEKDNIGIYFQKAESILAECDKYGIKTVSVLSEDYPKTLLEINDPPSVLYYIGNMGLASNAIAIVGTRHSTTLGNKIAGRLGAHFSSKYAVCNGLVEGIDEHTVINNGQVINNAIGVISGGLNYKKTCSTKHANIIEQVVDAGGLILSEFHPNQTEDKFSGSKASRVQAGLSKCLILVQSSIDGGSKYTVSAFAKLNRTFGVVEFSGSEEFQKDNSFAANRLIGAKGILGVAEFIGAKKTSLLSIKDIIHIATKEDYDKIERSIDEPSIMR